MATTTAPAMKLSFRIVALPLTTRKLLLHPTTAHKLPQQLTYYHFVTSPPSAEHMNRLSKRVTAKAAQLWTSLGQAEEGSWKRKAFLYGEKLMDRVEFEELALRSLDVSLGPKPLPRSANASTFESREYSLMIPLIYPPSFQPDPISVLRPLLRSRTPRHERGYIIWLLIAVFTAPLKLVPIIPNFPFFFSAWRSWSHFRALQASQYLEVLLKHGRVQAEPDHDLDRIYSKHMSGNVCMSPKDDYNDSETPVETPHSSHNVLLSPSAIPELAAYLEVPDHSTFVADMHRALEQVKLRLNSRMS